MITSTMRGCLVLGFLLVACGDDDDVGGAPDAGGADLEQCPTLGGAMCFQLPTAPMIAHTDTASGPAVLGCGALTPVDSTIEVTLSGKIFDYQDTGNGIVGATLTLYDNDGFTGTPIATVTSAAAGAYSVVLPIGTPDVLFGKVSATGFLDVYESHGRPDLSMATFMAFDLATVTGEFLDVLAGNVSATRMAGTATAALIVTDCDRNDIEHATVTLSSVAGSRSFVAGAAVMYGAPGDFPIPVRPDVRRDTNDNGAVGVFNVPTTGTVLVQVWGFPDAAALAQGEDGLVLVAEYPLPRFADAATGMIVRANQ